MTKKPIAIVYDWIDKWGGVERVLLTLHEIYPEADFYTSYYDREKAGWAKDLNIKTSFIEQMPKLIKGSRILSLPLYPYAFESFDFSEYELVISVTSSFAKAVITRTETNHICYLLTPTRYLWLQSGEYIKNSLTKKAVAPYLTKLRNWDYIAAQRPDKIISISKTVADRCKKYYQRESEVIYPPFDINYWENIKHKMLNIKNTNKILKLNGSQKYFLSVSRLESYKKVDLLLQSINLLKQNLVVVGEGTQLNNLKKIAGQKVIFLNKVTDLELAHLYANAEALIMPQEEDFGYVSLEAQFFGCPVIAYNKGGATETVIDGKTGILFEGQKSDSVQAAIKRFFMVKYELKSNISKFGLSNIKRFAKENFRKQFYTKLDFRG